MMTVSVRINKQDELLFKKYAEINGISLSELFRQSVINRIEDEYDLKTYEKAMVEFNANPVTYSHDEVWKELDL